jgi:hypothetical protein
MTDVLREVQRCAENAVSMCAGRGTPLDYSEASLAVVEETVAECGEWVSEMTSEQLTILIQDFGCYILEVGRRQFGGVYQWHEDRDQPVLVVDESGSRIAVITWDKVRGRLGGDEGDNLPFFYAGFADRVRQAVPGDDVLYV